MKFRMVDRILSCEPRTRITGVKTVSFEEYMLKAPFADEGRLPETLLIEALLQLGNWLIIVSSGFTQMGLVVRAAEIVFRAPVVPGESMRIEVDAASYRADGVLFGGRALVDGREVASGKGCLATPVALAEFHDPADLKVLFSQLFRPAAGNGT